MTSAKEIVQTRAIGASTIAMILGISPWGGPWEAYARIFRLWEEEQTEEQFWGKKLEPLIAEVFSQRMDLPIEWWDQRIYSAEYPWMAASPDAFVLDEKGNRTGVVEVKTAGLHRAGEWDRDTGTGEGVPEYYLAQVQQQLTACRLRLGYIPVLIAGNDFRIYQIEHDPVLEEILVEAGEEFWRKYILTHTAPPIGGSERARQYLRQRYPHVREKLRPATPQEREWLDQYRELRELLDQAKERRAELENRITEAIGEAEGLTWERGKFTWKPIQGRRVTKWDSLARELLVDYSPPEQETLIARYTHQEPGYRRIDFREKEAP